MITKLAEKAANVLCSNDNLEQDDRELYIYGFIMLFSKAFYFLLTALLGLMFGIVLESIVFYIMFSVIRGYAGGVHASTERACMISTSLSLLTCTAAMKVCIVYSLFVLPIIMLALSTISIIALSPLDTKEKRLSEEEKKVYRRKTHLFTTIILLVAVLSLSSKYAPMFYPCVFSLLLEGVLLLIGKNINPIASWQNKNAEA